MAADTAKQRPISPLLQGLATITLVVFILHAARPILMPITLAVLIGFILSPVVQWLERRRFGRVPAVIITVGLTTVLLSGLGWMIGLQITALARELPQQRTRIESKVNSLRGGGTFSDLMNMMNEIAVAKPPHGPEATTITVEPAGPPAESPAAPLVVRMEQEQRLSSLAESVIPVVEPLATAALVVILFIFLLANREDMRNRVIGLFGRGKLTGTTRVLGDAAERVSRFLLFQLIINATFGVILACGLALIGVKYALLWGFLSGMLRFIPYVGTWISAIFPFALSFATSDGWAQPLEVFIFFAVLDVFTGNVVEPLLLGHHTGVSPVALLVAAAFWAWLWGPIGLLLSTPITACMAVIGQHVPRMRKLALLLGDSPPLESPVAFYQRLMAKDEAEAKKLALADATDGNLLTAYDRTVLPALSFAKRDRVAGGLTIEEEASIFAGAANIIKTITAERAAATAPVDGAETPAQQLDRLPVIIGTPAHHQAEEIPLEMLAQALPEDGLQLRVLNSRILPVEVEQQVEESRASVVVISVLPPGGVPQVAYMCRRLKERCPGVRIVVAYFGRARNFDQLLVKLRKAGATYVTTSLTQTRDTLKSLVPAAPAPAVGHRLAAVNGSRS